MSSPVYRNGRPEETADLLNLWNTVFDVEHEFFDSLLRAEPDRLPGQSWVCEQDGKLVAAVQVFRRSIRDLDGDPVTVGCIGNVVTLEEYRGQGHSYALFERVIPAMRELGCRWSFLFTGINKFYERLGWHDVPTKSFGGVLLEPDREPIGVQRLALADRLSARPIYDAYNRSRPLTHDRPESHWVHSIGYRWRDKTTFHVPNEAYATIGLDDESAWVAECGHMPGHEDALHEVLRAARDFAVQNGKGRLAFSCGHSPALDDALPALVKDLEDTASYYGMAMALEGMTDAEIDAMFARNDARHYDADAF
jgi:GNAT superfamily N-acetyltransferase